ncbi:hypothetical protein [Bacillus sp. AK128]
MKLLGAFFAWVFILFIEIMWLLIESSDAKSEVIYVIIVITLVVGATGLNIFSKNSK